MISKYSIIFAVLFLLSCGGGGTSLPETPQANLNNGQITNQLQIVE